MSRETSEWMAKSDPLAVNSSIYKEKIGSVRLRLHSVRRESRSTGIIRNFYLMHEIDIHYFHLPMYVISQMEYTGAAIEADGWVGDRIRFLHTIEVHVQR